MFQTTNQSGLVSAYLPSGFDGIVGVDFFSFLGLLVSVKTAVGPNHHQKEQTLV